MYRASWTTIVQIDGANVASSTRELTVEAVDSISVAVADGAVDSEIEIQPGTAAQIGLLMITADHYDSTLEYRVNNAANPTVALDQPQLLTGAGALSLLGADPTLLLVTNGTGVDVNVQVLVGRDATP